MTFPTPYGLVKISRISSGYNGWQVMIDSYYDGLVAITERGLEYQTVNTSRLQGDDIAGLIDLCQNLLDEERNLITLLP